ncbi:MAG: hypothetical protein WB497_11945, partial [Pseudolabrys sp.]
DQRCIQKEGAPMKFELIIVTLLVAAMPVCAQAQAPQAPPPPQAPKAPKASPTPKAPKAVKDSKDSKQMTKLAVAQKVVKTISGDKGKPTAISVS